jgi:aspartate aminotransferase-like enzyme
LATRKNKPRRTASGKNGQTQQMQQTQQTMTTPATRSVSGLDADVSRILAIGLADLTETVKASLELDRENSRAFWAWLGEISQVGEKLALKAVDISSAREKDVRNDEEQTREAEASQSRSQRRADIVERHVSHGGDEGQTRDQVALAQELIELIES